MSTHGTPKVMGPLAGMFSSEAQAAIAAEEAAETLQQEQNAEQATAAASAAAVIAAETSTAATATATVEAASIDAMLGSVGLPVQQGLLDGLDVDPFDLNSVRLEHMRLVVLSCPQACP